MIHHADSYAATLVPYMIDMGIDIWQGCMESNNVSELVKKYGGKITFMGDIDNKAIGLPGWTRRPAAKPPGGPAKDAAASTSSLHHPGWTGLRLSGRYTV